MKSREEEQQVSPLAVYDAASAVRAMGGDEEDSSRGVGRTQPWQWSVAAGSVTRSVHTTH